MREFNRIERMTQKIQLLWQDHPDMRYFQFLEYLVNVCEIKSTLFFYEDDELEKKLDALIERRKDK